MQVLAVVKIRTVQVIWDPPGRLCDLKVTLPPAHFQGALTIYKIECEWRFIL